MIGADYTLYQATPPTNPLAPTILNGISALVKYIVISVGYLNPITGAYSLLSGIGADLNTPMNPFGYLYLRNFYSTSPNYDSRIYEASTGGATNGQGKMVLDAKNVETTGLFKSRCYNDDITPNYSQTFIGDVNENIRIKYDANYREITSGGVQSTILYQKAHIILTSTNMITISAPYINLNGRINTNVPLPPNTTTAPGIDTFYTNNPDQAFEQTNPFRQIGWG